MLRKHKLRTRFSHIFKLWLLIALLPTIVFVVIRISTGGKASLADVVVEQGDIQIPSMERGSPFVMVVISNLFYAFLFACCFANFAISVHFYM